MASYEQNVDAIGGGFGGFGGFGGGCGLLVVLLILFAVFSGGGIFGRGEHGRDHDRDFDELRSKFQNHCGCVSNCQIDTDVLTSRDAGIIEQKSIYEKGLERKIIERDMVITEQKQQIFTAGLIAELTENLNARFGQIEKELSHKPNTVPVFAETVDACVREQRRCGDDRGFRRDRDDCCFC